MEFKPEVDVDRFCARPEGSEALKVRIDLGSLGLEPDKVDFGVFDTKTHQPILDWQAYHWRGLGPLPLPGKENISRIAIDSTETTYAFTGATWFTKLCRLAEKYSGRKLHEFGQILDWGCGTGRILRYFDKSMQGKVVGVDIDPVNIQWCRDHMPDSTFVLVNPDTPMPFEDNSFDLIYGHSVFTHLSEYDQNSWLAELLRVLKPGGYCFTTVTAELGWFACFSIFRDSWQFYEYISTGIRDSGHVQMGVDIQKPGFYRNTAHTSKYIKSHWGKYFEILEIIDGFADFQSLVVMHKPNPS
jgi:SAM-dependent methyltransferase